MRLQVTRSKNSCTYYVAKSFRTLEGKYSSKIVEKLGSIEDLIERFGPEDPEGRPKHMLLDKFISNDDYNIKKAYVLSNEREVFVDNGITYVPIYYIMFFQNISNVVEEFLD